MTHQQKDDALHYCADCHSHCGQTIAAQARIAELEEGAARSRPQIDEQIKRAVEEEREACAKIARSFNDSSGYRIPERIANAIAERGLNNESA